MRGRIPFFNQASISAREITAYLKTTPQPLYSTLLADFYYTKKRGKPFSCQLILYHLCVNKTQQINNFENYSMIKNLPFRAVQSRSEPFREIMASLMRVQQYGGYIVAQKSFDHWSRPIK
jgi:hypothetical protein